MTSLIFQCKKSVGLAVLIAGMSFCGSVFAGQIKIPSEGLLFDLDASDTTNFRYNENGFITNWVDSANGEVFYNASDEADGHLPYYDETAFGGRGAVSFGFPRGGEPTARVGSYLKHDGATRNQTVFLVYHWTNAVSNVPQMGGLFGQDNTDFGIRGDYYNRTYYSYDGHAMRGYVWLDGVCMRNRTGTANDVVPSSTNISKDPMVYCCVLTNDVDATATSGSCHGTYAVTIGHYDHQYNHTTYMNRFFAGKMAEVIAYDRALSDDEVDYVNDVLMHKWYGTETKHPFMTVTGDPVEAGAPVPAYGKYMEGEHATSFSIAAELETDPRDGARIVTADKADNQRTVYRGYEVVDAAGNVLQSSATDESFDFASDAAVTVRWKFRKDCNVGLSVEGEGTVKVNGKSSDEWVRTGELTKLEAVPADGWHFAYWKGETEGVDILADRQHANVQQGMSLTAVFEEGAPEYPKLLSRGLCYRVDASDSATCLTDADSFVTNWHSRVGKLSFDVTASGIRPYYTSAAMSGKGGIRFGLAKDGTTCVNTPLGSSVSPGPVQTVVLALNCVKSSGDMFYLAGYTGSTHSTDDNYGLNCFYCGAIYNQSMIKTGWAWMDDGCYRQFPGHCSDATTDFVCRFDTPYGQTHSLVVVGGDTPVPDTTRPWGFANFLGNPTQMPKRCYAGDIGESLGYSRRLSPAEARYVIAYLNKKWKDEDASMTKMENGSGVVISSDTAYESLLLKDTPTVTVSAGATLKVTNLLVQEGDVAFVVEEGATLEIPEIVRYDATDKVIVALNGGTLVLNEPGQSWRYNSENSSYDKYESLLDGRWASDTALPPLKLPGAISGTGRLVKKGARPLVLSTDDVIPDGLAYSLAGGTLDLNGRSLAAATVEGPARIVNSAETPVTLTVGRDADFALEARVVGNVDVVRQGTGAMTLVDSASTGSLTLLSGVNKVDPGLMTPGAISNLACHLDASRPDSMTLNELGEVVEWRSISGDGGVFKVMEGPSSRKPTTYFTYRGPKYSATALDGKPGLLFSQDEDGNSLSCTNSLFGNMSYRANTMVAVVRPHKYPCSVGSHWGHIWADSNYGASMYSSTCLKIAHWASDSYKYWHWGSEENSEAQYYRQMMVNGKVIYDAEKEIRIDNLLATDCIGRPTVVAFTVSGNCTFTPAIGSLCDHVRSLRGVVSEICVYGRVLSEDELVKLESALMAKWGVEPDEEGRTAFDSTLSSASALVLGSGATLDLGGTTQEVASVVYDGNCEISNGALTPGVMLVIPDPSGVLPLLKATGCAVDVTDCNLAFKSNPEDGRFLKATQGGTLVGPFKSETGASKPVSMNARRASVGRPGIVLLVR